MASGKAMRNFKAVSSKHVEKKISHQFRGKPPVKQPKKD